MNVVCSAVQSFIVFDM